MSQEDEIESVAIYPAIGIARVGNSPDDFFSGTRNPGDKRRGPGPLPGPTRPDQAASGPVPHIWPECTGLHRARTHGGGREHRLDSACRQFEGCLVRV
jgi:hypothetical protein